MHANGYICVDRIRLLRSLTVISINLPNYFMVMIGPVFHQYFVELFDYCFMGKTPNNLK